MCVCWSSVRRKILELDFMYFHNRSGLLMGYIELFSCSEIILRPLVISKQFVLLFIWNCHFNIVIIFIAVILRLAMLGWFFLGWFRLFVEDSCGSRRWRIIVVITLRFEFLFLRWFRIFCWKLLWICILCEICKIICFSMKLFSKLVGLILSFLRNRLRVLHRGIIYLLLKLSAYHFWIVF